MLSLRFPTGMLFDLKMRGGPLPDRYDGLGTALVNPGPLSFEPEEALDIRDWLEDQPEELLDDAALDAAVEAINTALQVAGLCGECGGVFRVDDGHGQSLCARCGEPAEP